jgi:23S rRNA pseudouridine955/2504/2580 synthase
MTDEQPLMKRMALHSFSLEFALLSGKNVKVEAPYPKDFKALIKQLEANAR